MSEDEEELGSEGKGSEGTGDTEMPSPPDLTSLFKDQSDKLDQTYKASSAAFDVFAQRDAQFAALTSAYQQEIVKVLTIAQSVANPPMAIASVPLVLAAANEAFAKAPVTEQAVTALIEARFATFKQE